MSVTHHELTVQCRDENDAIRYAEVKVEVIVDEADIARFLGIKALRNKSKRSKLAVGVRCEVIRDVPTGWKRTGY